MRRVTSTTPYTDVSSQMRKNQQMIIKPNDLNEFNRCYIGGLLRGDTLPSKAEGKNNLEGYTILDDLGSVCSFRDIIFIRI